jgi:pyroglutamyl-peptidase
LRFQSNRASIAAMKILMSGFEPFGGEVINPSWEALTRLPDSIDGNSIVKIKLPTEYKSSWSLLEQTIKDENPQAVLCFGQAEGRTAINLEKVAINLMDARIPDNAEYQPRDLPLEKSGDLAYFSNLPLAPMLEALRKTEIPVQISLTAGAFICNAVFYRCRHFFPEIPSGFIHLPYSTAQVTEKPQWASMSLETMVQAIEIIVSVLNEPD